MASKNDLNWQKNYDELCEYIALHGHQPDKHRVEFRGLLNWAKYQRKRIKEGALDEEKTRLFNELMDSRSSEHTGGRRKSENAESK